jgi:hypothetical protein
MSDCGPKLIFLNTKDMRSEDKMGKEVKLVLKK